VIKRIAPAVLLFLATAALAQQVTTQPPKPTVRELTIEHVEPFDLSDTDKLNGLEWAGEVAFKQAPAREVGDPGIAFEGLLGVNVTRRRGQWTARRSETAMGCDHTRRQPAGRPAARPAPLLRVNRRGGFTRPVRRRQASRAYAAADDSALCAFGRRSAPTGG